MAQILESFRLTDVMDERTAILPCGKQRLLEIAVAVASRAARAAAGRAGGRRPRGRAAHDPQYCRRPAERCLRAADPSTTWSWYSSLPSVSPVLVNGALFVEGTPDEIARDARVKEVYLGEATDA